MKTTKTKGYAGRCNGQSRQDRGHAVLAKLMKDMRDLELQCGRVMDAMDEGRCDCDEDIRADLAWLSQALGMIYVMVESNCPSACLRLMK